MLCPSCGSDSKVVDSRPNGDATIVARRRQCQRCKLRWTTHERDTGHPDNERMVQLLNSLRRIKIQVIDAETKLTALIKGEDKDI